MSRVTQDPRGPGAASASEAPSVRESLAGKIVCPFCGQQKSNSGEPCPRCTMEDTPATRQATKTRIGPWYVLQNRSPSAPGMKFATLLWLVNKGHVTARSIVRGPTTHQLWRYAAHVRGLSREFGLCYSCGSTIERTTVTCPHCDRPQEPPIDPDVLVEAHAPDGKNVGLRASTMRDVEVPEKPGGATPRRNGATREPARPVETPEEDLHELSHSDRLRFRGELTVRQRQEQLLRTGGRQVSGMDLATALQEPATAERPRRVSVINVVLFVLMLGVGAAAVVLYLRPEYRAPTAQWAQDLWQSVRDRAAAFTPGRPGEESTPTVARDEAPARPVEQPPLARKPESSPPPVVPPPSPTTPQREPRDEVALDSPAQRPAVPQLARDREQPRTVPEPTRQPNPSRTARVEPPADPAPGGEQARTLEQAIDEARELWNQAMDAEARQDFAAAVKYYEQIKRLPAAARQSALENNLKFAREQLQSNAKAQ